MNKRRVVGAVLLVVVLLLVSVIPASAGAIKTPVSGQCSVTWNIMLAEDFRWWVTGQSQNIYHQRGVWFEWLCDFDDDRLDGYLWGDAVFNTHGYFLPDGTDYHVGPTHGEGLMLDAAGNPMWEGHYTAMYEEEPGVATGQWVFHGVGPNEGLELRLDYDHALMVEWVIYAEGEIIDPGK